MNLNIHCNGCCLPEKSWLQRHSRPLIKYLLVMKFITAILLLSLNVSANIYAQQINLSVSKAPFHEVLQKLRKQTGYNFFYVSHILKTAKPVTADLKNSTLENALKVIMKDQPFNYIIQKNSITIKAKPKPGFLDKVLDMFQAITVRGKVTDESGNPLAGASVKADSKVAITNSEGNFELNGINDKSTIEVSYIGYASVSLPASSDFMSIKLSLNSADLQEVVVNKGYYTTKQELNTGSVGHITAKEIERQPVNDFVMALEGRISGLNISQNNGVPGSSLNINIRGRNSIANGNETLFIIDGVPFPSQSLSYYENASGGAKISPLNSISV
ncbi:DUF4974 domain-containing protein [Chitinophaga agri]|uniref:TonB-dependent receptor plug domain-containing protein n=1 Tax=Chitinophaga agri TaxID=2703787 RepID=A0A6B9ZQQ7_9BACT|nr:DUF4974 domain-containing protein [Chitinophaga agri]QHS63523.1 TonB-dependent receptor plug domain-containing protein [Chitinophaga agri]